MNAFGGDSNRSVLPRWRTSRALAGSAEAAAVSLRVAAPELSDHSFEKALEDWRVGRTVGLLADLFSIAVVEGRSGYLPELAREINQLGDRAPKALQRMASRISLGSSSDQMGAIPDVAEPGVVGQYISSLRSKVKASPRNAFAWNDLSYAYNLIGEAVKAERAMLVALKVSGSHRLLARNASRLYVHNADPEKALRVLRGGQAFHKDPWLLSAHLAVSQAARLPIASMSAARKAYEHFGSGHRCSSELGMALATQEMWDGKAKRAKALARESSVEPTENALAQAVWLSPRLRADLVSPELLNCADGAFEARAWKAYYRGEWATSIAYVRRWLRDEPYSVAPAQHGSFVAATLLRDYDAAVELADAGLKFNPDSWSLRNNLVVGLAMRGDIQKAEVIFARMREPDGQSSDYPVWLATSGLLSYRRRDVEAGRDFYALARGVFERNKDRMSLLTLALYQSVEEAEVGNVAESERLVRDVGSKLGLRWESGLLPALEKEIVTTVSRT